MIYQRIRYFFESEETFNRSFLYYRSSRVLDLIRFKADFAEIAENKNLISQY